MLNYGKSTLVFLDNYFSFILNKLPHNYDYFGNGTNTMTIKSPQNEYETALWLVTSNRASSRRW